MKDRTSWFKEKLFKWLAPAAFLIIGFGSTLLDWQIYFDEGEFRPRMAFFGPLLGFLGLAMLIGPAAPDEPMLESASEVRRREQRQRLALLVFLAGVAIAGLNFALMYGWLGGLAG